MPAYTQQVIRRGLFILCFFFCQATVQAASGSGTEGASFLNIPVGARPAALGSAYAPPPRMRMLPSGTPAAWDLPIARSWPASISLTSNPFIMNTWGLSIPSATAVPWEFPSSTWDRAISALRTSNSLGSYSAHYVAYSLAYGQKLGDKFSLGLTGKIINAKISDVSATAYAFDLGSLYKATDRLTLAGVLTNVGSRLTFIDQADSLPLAFHLGAAYELSHSVNVTAEGIYNQTGETDFRTGVEWKPMGPLALRVGYRTDTLAGLSALAGLSTGFGLNAWGSEFSYAWVPMGDLGNTQYFSFVIRFGGGSPPDRNLIHYHARKPDAAANAPASTSDSDEELMQLLNDNTTSVSQNQEPSHEKNN